MTIREAVSAADKIKQGNVYSEREKIGWLSTLDGIIKKEIIDTHEGAENIQFGGYDNETDVDTELLVYEPYTNVYVYYMAAQIDLNDGEITKYSNDMTLFNNAYRMFSDSFNRLHKPLGIKNIKW